MAEYIEREALIENLSLMAKYQIGERQQGILGVIQTIKMWKTADVVEVKRGKWKDTKAIVGINNATLDFEIGNADRCSLCGEDFLAVRPRYNFCPNCGADMRGNNEKI